jgi:SAM-dependent methyltransferase
MITTSMVRMQERLNQLWGPRKHLPGVETYLLPSDRCEHERLYFEHYALKVALGRSFFAPLTRPQSILDVGCGAGVWAADLCHAFPQARVVGFDLAVVPLLNQPANYQFVRGSLLGPLPFADDSFEYVHQRLMCAAIPTCFWKAVLTELVRVTAPGGYIELFEIAPGLGTTAGPATARMVEWSVVAERRSGIDPRFTPNLPAVLDQAGAHVFFQQIFWLPLGSSYGQQGRLMEQDASAFFASLAPLVQERLSLSQEEYQHAWNLMREEWAQRSSRCPFIVVLARKPPRAGPSMIVSH